MLQAFYAHCWHLEAHLPELPLYHEGPKAHSEDARHARAEHRKPPQRMSAPADMQKITPL